MTPALFAAIFAAAASAAAASAAPAQDAPSPMDALADAPVFAEDASARDMIAGCRAMVPADVEIAGHINRRSRHGTQVAAYRYKLTRKGGATNLELFDKAGNAVPFEKGGRILDTDVTWSDLTMGYLWWDDVAFDEKAEGESLQGVICKVVVLKSGDRAVRVWIDRRTGAMLQAEETFGGKVARELFCTSLKKFGDRWAPRNIEVGPKGAKYRTKIVVESIDGL